MEFSGIRKIKNCERSHTCKTKFVTLVLASRMKVSENLPNAVH